jgi:signal transduction histidine kinase
VSTGVSVIQRVRSVDLLVVDQALAALMTAGALVDASSQLHHGLNALGVVPLVALTGSVAWRRRDPVLSTLVAVTGFAAFVRATGYAGDGAFEVAAIALNFYLLGRRARGRERTLACVGVFAYWLVGVAVVAYSVPGGSVSKVLGPWVMVGALPFAVGRVLDARRTRAQTLETSTARLEHEQHARARRAALEERNRMARELHDVIAHNVSVMVVQTSAARRVAHAQPDAARTALRAVEQAGRDALVELRRIVGVLRRQPDELGGSVSPGLSQLNALVDRSRGAGLEVELRVEGSPGPIPPGVDLVAYRVLQEALTNVLKHAGGARADVTVRFGTHELELAVLDPGAGSAPVGGSRAGSGHGLIGMNERVALYGGELHAGRRAGGGFEVRARIPLNAGPTPAAPLNSSEADWDASMVAAGPGPPWRWLDPSLAVVLLVVLEVSVLTASHPRGPLLANMALAAGMALAAIWRRRSPLLFALALAVLALIGSWLLTPVTGLAALGAYLALVPAYTVAAWEDDRGAAVGLAIVLCAALALDHGTPGTLVGATFAVIAGWAAGRAFRARRLQTATLSRTSARLGAEREDRVRLAVAGERTRIWGELHEVVAHSVAGMVVQAEAAHGLIGTAEAEADAAMSAIEDAGRQALAEMRRILGVLRHAQEGPLLEPRPGVQQIYALIQNARESGQAVELSVSGEPGTLPAAVDLGIYRILEEALASAARQPGNMAVALQFGEQELKLRLSADCDGPSGWPTDAMRERVAMCRGELHPDKRGHGGWRLTARLPRGLQGALEPAEAASTEGKPDSGAVRA